MLKLIDHQSHNKYRATIDSFLNLLSQCQNIQFPSEVCDQATFLIASAEKSSPSEQRSEGEIYGGALIYPQGIADSLELATEDTNEDTIIKLTSAFQPKGDEYWVARICLYLEHGSSAADVLQTQGLCHQFYKTLYPHFKVFGERKGIEYLAYTLRIAETYHMKTFEFWPYQLGVAVADPHYAFAHGILSLQGKRFKARPGLKCGRQS